MRFRRPPRLPTRAALCFGIVVAAAGFSACGRKTFIRPPELAAPAPVASLAATNVQSGVQLTWSRPTTYADGTRMTDLGAFIVERSTGDDPFVRVATIAVTDQERFQQERRFRWVDADTAEGTTYVYRVLAATTDGYVSMPSEAVAVERRAAQDPAPSPTASP